MPSIEEYMIANEDKYGIYYDLLQRFAAYNVSEIDEQKRVLYNKSYDLIFDLAEERGPSTNTQVPPQNMWTAFLPKNDIIQNYLDNTILKNYPAIDSVPRVTLFYILQTQLSGSLILKSKLADGYFNAFGDPTELSSENLSSGYMCSNGVVYEIDKVLEPNVFTTVPGTLFFDKNYSTLLFVLNQANMLSSISNPDQDVTVFATTNDQLEAYGIRYNATGDYVEMRGPVDGKWARMRESDLTIFAQDQIHQGLLTNLNGAGGFARMNSDNYIKYGNNQAAAGENQVFNRIATVEEIEENEKNGYLVKVDQPIQSRVVMGQLLTGDLADPEFSEFAQILIDLRLLKRFRDPITKEDYYKLKFLAAADNWTAFIPTNDAVAQARAEGIIPYEKPSSSEGQDSLENLMMYHFLVDKVVFDDGKESGSFKTNYSYIDTLDNSTEHARLKIMNSPNELSIEDNTGQVVNVDHGEANILVRQGVMHKIDAVLKYADLK
jgi:uncharacterized surface protein with fasciclin (FAS1) repeats